MISVCSRSLFGPMTKMKNRFEVCTTENEKKKSVIKVCLVKLG